MMGVKPVKPNRITTSATPSVEAVMQDLLMQMVDHLLVISVAPTVTPWLPMAQASTTEHLLAVAAVEVTTMMTMAGV